MIRRWLLAVLMVASMVMPFLPAGKAEAFIPGRAEYHGYFRNIYDDQGDFVLSGGVWPTFAPLTAGGAPYAESFISIIETNLGGAFGGRNIVGAQFLILTMMGQPAGTPGVNAWGLLPAWRAAVRGYAENGWVSWGIPWAFSTNTYWQGMNGGGPEPPDEAWYNDPGGFTPQAIVFHNPALPAQFYVIKQNCANPVGAMGGLSLPPPPDYNIQVTADRNGSPQQVVAGRTYSVGANVANLGPGTSEGGVMQIMRPAQASLPCAPDCVPAGMGVAGMVVGGFRNGSGVPGIAGQNWWYTGGPLPPGGPSARGVTQWTVAPGTPVGTVITFNVYFYKANFAGAVASSSITFTVVSERNPGVQGFNADIHAGGGLCGGNLSIPGGQVQGNANATSMGQYVVSAELASGINNFRSNGALGAGGDTLKLGQAGNYSVICRPDLVKAAAAYRTAGVGYTTNGSGSVDISGMSGVVFLDNPTVRIHGTVNNKLTLVAAGNVEIDGTIQINNTSYARADLPSLGVIAEGNIGIRAGVLRVDAYLFANGDIDTCMEASIACANPSPLVVNGFFMAQGILFHRIGPLNTNGAPVTEQVTLNPQIYLNPPKLFDASVDDILLEGQGERRPLF